MLLIPCASLDQPEPISHVNAATSSEVGELMKDQLRDTRPPKEPLPDEGIEFYDSGSDTDDSGLRDLIHA